MLVVPGSKVAASFFTFGSTPPPKPTDPAEYPPIYYGSGEGILTMASVNAGNSQSLEVGLGGVNRQFRIDLGTGPGRAGQKYVDSGADDYQSRHKNLLAKAGSGGTASESYQTDDPCVFSYVQAALVNTKATWYEGVCFIDVFSTKLCPAGNSKNAAMVYAAPPYGDNYASDADFLAAIQAMAVHIIKTIAGYNALAPKQSLPVIQALRNTLFSSGLYNRAKPVDPDKVARAIFAGFQSELQAQDAGLVELQFPVGRGAQGLLFGPVQDDLTNAPNLVPAAHPAKAPLAIIIDIDTDSDSDSDDDGDGIEMEDMGDQADSDNEGNQLVVNTQTGQNAQAAVAGEQFQFNQQLAGGQTPSNYAIYKPKPGDENYIQPDQPMEPEQSASSTTNPSPVAQSTYDTVVLPQPAENPVDDDAAESSSENDPPGYSTCCKVVSGILGTFGGVIAVGGSFLWAFLFGGGRKYVKSGPGTFEASDQTVSANDLDPSVDVDLISLNGLNLIENIAFPSPPAGGTWSVTPATHALFTPATIGANSSVSVQYVLVAVAIQGTNAQTDPKTLTINFNPAPAIATQQTANDRTSAVTIDIPSLYKSFAGTVQVMNTTGGTWNVDPSTNKVTYTPDSTLTGTTATASYVRLTTWGAASTPATITITLPAATVPTPTATGAATFLSNDTKTQGDWLPAHGADGYSIAGDQNSNPSYVTPSLAGAPPVKTFTNSGSEALVKASSTASRVAAAWSAASPIVIDLNCSDTTTVHQVALYWADYDPNAAGQTVEVRDANGLMLASQSLPATFTGGLYLVWNISGHVKISVSNAAGNAVLSAIFFGGPTIRATFVKSDATTQGGWQGVYGADGYSIAGDQTKNPGYVTPVISPPAPYVWAQSTKNANALQKAANPADRVAAHWFADSRAAVPVAVMIDLPFSTAAVHQVAVYCLDYDLASRSQTVEVLDASGKVLDTQSLSSFSGGVYLVWKVAGHIQIRIKNTSVANGAASGVFFDAPSATNMAFAAFSAAPVAYDFTVWMTDAPQSVKLDFLKHCQIPGGFKHIELSDGTSDVTVPKQGRWSYEVGGTPATMDILFQPVAGLRLSQPYSMKYCVVDQHGMKSNQAAMTVDYRALPRLMPRAANFLSSADARYGKFSTADVLTNCSAFFGIKKESVVLAGVQDVLQGNPAPGVYVRDDGKTMSVVGEGMWVVDDNGRIAFQSDANLSYAPTPALYRFSDAKGYQSNAAVVLFDSGAVDSIAKGPAALGALSDANFWKNYSAQITDPSGVDLPPEQFIAVTQTFAVVIRTLGSVGPNPFSQSDFDANYNSWGGGTWADLLKMSAKMTAAAVTSGAPKYAARYWQLNLMVRMAVKAFPSTNS